MAKVLIGLLVGVILSIGLGLMAQEDTGSRTSNKGLIGPLSRVVNTICNVSVGNTYRTLAGRCGTNDVMTGTSDNGIYCSEIQVECLGLKVRVAAN